MSLETSSLPSSNDLLSVLSTHKAGIAFHTMAGLATRNYYYSQESAFALYTTESGLTMSDLLIPDIDTGSGFFTEQMDRREVDARPLVCTDTDKLDYSYRDDLAALAHIHPSWGQASFSKVGPSEDDLRLWQERANPFEIIMGADTSTVKFLFMKRIAGLAINIDTYSAVYTGVSTRQTIRALELANVACTHLLFDRRTRKFQSDVENILDDWLEK